MKIVLIQPPQIDSIDDRLNPLLSLLYIAAYARASGFTDVHYCELAGIKPPFNLEPELQEYSLKVQFMSKIPEADVYGITLYTPSYQCVQIITSACRQINQKAKICLGGSHPSALPELTLQEFPNVDTVFVGEAEKSFTKWLRDGCPKGIVQAERLTEAELNDLPPPARDLINYEDYTRTVEGERCIDVLTSRGCSYNCTFCHKVITGNKCRFHSLDYVKRELYELRKKYNTFLFLDDVFTFKRTSRLYPLLEWMEGQDFRFRNTCKPGYDQPEDFIRLKRAGCQCIGTGTETGSPFILARMNKNCTVQDNENTIKWIKDAGIIARCYFLFGFPGETEETVMETLEFINKVNPDQMSLFTYTVFPGDDIYKNPDKYGVTWISKEWRDYQLVKGNGEGGFNVETKWLKREKAMELFEMFKTEIRKRTQKGIQQAYYKKIDEVKGKFQISDGKFHKGGKDANNNKST